jgi:HEPN domain-containing protein
LRKLSREEFSRKLAADEAEAEKHRAAGGITGDEEDRRNLPIVNFNLAESYWQAAANLKKQKLKTTHPDLPVCFLYYHAIELYLKSFLRLHGHSARELRKNFSHHICRLSERAAKLGLVFDDEDVEVFSLMSNTDAVIRSRYLQTGPFRWPAPQALDRTCRSLRQSVGAELKKKGIPVRLRSGARRAT